MNTKRKEMVEAVPRRELHLFDEMDRMFDTLLNRGWLRPFREMWPEWTAFEERVDVTVPRIDLIDREKEILVRAEVPGVDKKDLTVDLSGGLLTIRGERRHEEKTEEGELYRAEISRGTFSRTMRLPEDVDFEKSKASFKDGILEIHLPKTHVTERRHIKVE
jgi:HSP20 family protein